MILERQRLLNLALTWVYLLLRSFIHSTNINDVTYDVWVFVKEGRE